MFYRDVLGLTPAKGHGEPPYGEFVWDDKAILALFDRSLMAKAVGLSAGEYSRGSVGRSALILETKDVDSVAGLLRKRNVKILKGPTDHLDWGIRTVHLQDPDGYLIEIYSELKKN